MSEPIRLPNYFASPMRQIWSIEETGEAIEWKDQPSTAILMRHLQLICLGLGSQLKGLPPLTAILFIVDALSKGWPTELCMRRVDTLVLALERQLDKSFCSTDPTKVPPQVSPQSRRASLNRMSQWLHDLQKVGSEFRHGVAHHVAILSEIFEQLDPCWLTTKYETEQVLEWLENVIGDRGTSISFDTDAQPFEFFNDGLIKAAIALDHASKQSLDAETIRLRMRTGLDRLPDHEPLPIVERYPLAALARELADSKGHLSALARLAQTVASTVSLPRLPSDPDILPMGGVSDVTNRGKPDRLLLSELALDNDLLIARIANGQALYMRREQPPQPEPKQRCLIVEQGVRMWGTMRLLSAAFAFGSCLAQEQRGEASLNVITVAGDRAWREDLSTRAGIEHFYERLETNAHPGEALARLAKGQLLDLDLSHPPILILSHATTRDATFSAMVEQFPKPHLIARVEATGEVELLQRSAAGDVVLQRMRLDPTTIVDQARVPSNLNKQLPMFLQQPNQPLRFSAHRVGDCVQVSEGLRDCCWILTKDRRVLLLDDHWLGAIEVGHVPGGPVLACRVASPTCWQLVIESRAHKSPVIEHLLIQANKSRGISIYPIDLESERRRDVTYCFDRDELIRVGSQVTFLDTRNGQTLARGKRCYPYLGGAFFGSTEIYVATSESDNVVWRCLGKVPSVAGCASRLECGIPVVYAHDLTWMVRLDGTAALPHPTAYQIHALRNHNVLRVEPGGTEMLVALRGVTSATDTRLLCSTREEKLVKLSLKSPSVTYWGKSTRDKIVLFERRSSSSYQCVSIRNRITGISFSAEDGPIALHRQGVRLAMNLCETKNKTSLELQASVSKKNDRIFYFQNLVPKPGGDYSRWRLRHVKLPAGDAWLDERGLLHLRAVDGTELSLVLCEDLLAGWHSSGLTFGSSYFTASSENFIDIPHQVRDWIAEFAKEQRDSDLTDKP